MTLLSSTELRRAAEHARAFAKGLTEPQAKQAFSDLADRWEAEATALEAITTTERFHGIGSGRRLVTKSTVGKKLRAS
jgi:hypothetical protein